MSKINIIIQLFLASSTLLFAQHTSMTTEDFNGDGIDDQMKCSYDIGNSSGGSSCEITDGKTQKTFKLSNYSSFSSIKKWVAVAGELQEKENEYFSYRLKKEVLPVFRPTPDQSLVWIINSGLNTKTLQDNTYFDLIFNPNTAWRQGEPELPSTYYIAMNAATISKIVEENETSNRAIGPSNKKDFLVYFGDTHFTGSQESIKDFVPVSKSETYELLKTKHGVLAKKGNSYKWLFVTDRDINDAPEKLRWASIEEVILKDHYVIIKQGLAPNALFNIYLIDIETGKGARLKIGADTLSEKGVELTDLRPEEQFSIQGEMIVIGTKLKFPLPELKQKLELSSQGN